MEQRITKRNKRDSHPRRGEGVPRADAPRCGAALVIVLTFLTLALVLLLAFFSTVTTESSNASSYAAGVTKRHLAESAVNYVMGAIRQATSQGNNIAWASQPGMIRTYGGGGNTASSAPLAFYKLYSSDHMIVSGNTLSSGNYDPASELDATWRSRPSIWTDLNSPVVSSSGLAFPIIDGNGIRELTRNAAGVSVPPFYGYDRNADGYPDIDGFAVDPSRVNFNPVQELSITNTPVPMPVKWIYILRDGSLTAPDGEENSGKTATWSSSSASAIPTADNPIVGRIAFWTDDETAKINLNTASEGSYADHVSFATQTDLAFGRNGPAQREYNRYPGHPAGVSLSPVLGTMLGLPEPSRFSLQPTMSTASPLWTGARTYAPDMQFAPGVENYLTRLFSITPRFVWGGSQMGSVATAASITGAAGISKADLQVDRLYASVDEALFAPPELNDPTRPLNPPGLPGGISPEQLEAVRFFLTTSSRAPDVNLFNQPKISMWPVDDPTRPNPTNDYFPTTADTQSPLDKLIAFCSTINQNPYYFTRNDPFDPGGDFTQRNRQIYDYLAGRLTVPLPGFGAAFSLPYPGRQTNQLVTQFYDFIRGAINLNDGTAPGAPFTMDKYRYSFCRPFEYRNLAVPYGYEMTRLKLGQVAPFQHPDNGTKGIGRFPTIQQASIMFIATAANQPPLQVGADGKPVGPVINPLHPYPNTVPSAGNLSVESTAPGGEIIYRFIGNYPNPTLYLSGSWLHAPSQRPAANGLILSSTASFADNKYAQAHSGLRYLTEQNPATGAFDLPNPRYRGPALNYGQTQIQSVLFFSMANPAAGNPALASHYKLRVTGAGAFRAGGIDLNLRDGIKEMRSDDKTAFEISSGGVTGFGTQLIRRFEGDAPDQLVFYSDPVTVTNSTSPGSSSFDFTGGTLTVEILNPVDDSVVQTATIEFPSADFPTPILPPTQFINPSWFRNVYTSENLSTDFPRNPWDLVPGSMLTLDNTSALSTNPNFNVGTGGETYFYPWGFTRFFCRYNWNEQGPLLFPARNMINPADERYKLTCDTIRAVEVAYGDTRLTAALRNVPKDFFVPHRYYDDTEMPSAHSLAGSGYEGAWFFRGATLEGLTDFFENDPAAPRISYAGSAYWGLPNSAPAKIRSLHAPLPNDRLGFGNAYPGVTSSATFGLSNAQYASLWPGITPFPTLWFSAGDFDNGIITSGDGPLINKPEEGMSPSLNSGENPYFGSNVRYYLVGDSVFSPNRQIASPVAFGSLPAGIDPDNPSPSDAYRTLLFCPNPNSQSHPALNQTPPDYALLDFFQMPVVEPYAISEPLSTAGKVNMNYQIAPFSFIKRETAIRGVLRGVSITAIPDRWIKFYRTAGVMGNDTQIGADGTTLRHSTSGFNAFRYPICEDDTLREFQHRFDENDIFRTPSEICSIWLYPAVQPTRATAAQPQRSLLNPGPAEPSTHAAIKAWWYGGPGESRKSLTGDNMRERPYSHLYPRLTTKSNTYTVHVRVQSLMKVRTDFRQNTFNEDRDQVVGEYRGSTTIERYIDPGDPDLPDFATNPGASLDPYYRFRVLSTKQFQQ